MGDVKPLIFVVSTILILGIILNLVVTPFIQEGINVEKTSNPIVSDFRTLVTGVQANTTAFDGNSTTLERVYGFLNEFIFGIPANVVSIGVNSIFPQKVIDFILLQFDIMGYIPTVLFIPMVIIFTIVLIWAIREFIGFT